MTMLKDFPVASKVPDICGGCGKPILDRFYLLAVDDVWHSKCLKCIICSQSLEKEISCFYREGNIYCKEDYYRLFFSRCARCSSIINKDDMVMKAKEYVYHLDCFYCHFCEIPLNPGDTAVIRDGRVYCAAHSDLHFFPEPNLQLPINYPEPNQKGRPRKRKYNSQSIEGADLSKDGGFKFGIVQHDSNSSLSGYYDDSQSPRGPDGLSSSSRTKRVRTSFKHHQLRTMKSYFSINQNPDAKDLKQLAQKTGLSKRVLQVWFQNARAKFRRNIIRHEGNQKSSQSGYPFGAATNVEGNHLSIISDNANSSVEDITNQNYPIYQ